MLQKPSHPDVFDVHCRSPLKLAAENGHVEIVRLLLEAGADTNRINDCGDTALMSASQEQGHLEVLRLLL